MNEIYRIDVNKEIFTADDAKDAAKAIFQVEKTDFENIINEKWYRRFLSALTLYSGDKKKAIKSISSLSKLQTLFMRVYYEQYRELDFELNEIIHNLSKINAAVKRLYEMCVSKIQPQEDLRNLSNNDKQILLLMMSKYRSLFGNEDILRKYRTGIAKTVSVNLPEGDFKNEQLLTVQMPKVFYRCLLEMCALDEGLESMTMPDDMYNATDYLNISRVVKNNVEIVLKKELESFGAEYLISKYVSTYDLDACELIDVSETKFHECSADAATKISVDVIKKVYQLCRGYVLGNIKVTETENAFVVKTRDKDLHIVEKRTGAEDIIHLNGTPVEEYWDVCIGLGNSIFVQTGTSRAVYRIDITTKTIQRVYENKEAGELVSVNAEGITLIDTSGSEWILRKISQQNEEIVQLPKCDWIQSYRVAIQNNKMYVLAATASLEERFHTLELLELGVYSIDLNKPEKYVPVKENIIGHNPFFSFSSIIKTGPKGWVLLSETDVKSYLEPTNNDKSFALQYFSFEEETLATLAYGCGHKSKQKRSAFSKKSLIRTPNEFFIIGDAVCYRSGEKRFEAMVALDEPLAVKFM